MATSAAPLFSQSRILVKPLSGLPHGAIEQFHAQFHVPSVRPLFSADADDIQIVELPPGATVREMVQHYLASGLVDFAEPDFFVTPALEPNEPSFTAGSLWHLHNLGLNGATPGADIHAAQGWDIATSATNLIVAVVDTGIRYTHEDLAANMWVNPGEIPGNAIDDDADGVIDDVFGFNAPANSGDPIDRVGHGTRVAGILGALGNNGRGVSGVAWQVRLMACRYVNDTGVGTVSDAAKCVDFARLHGARIINASLEIPSYSYAFDTAIRRCQTDGVLVVVAAGNSGSDSDALPQYPAAYTNDNIVAVAATTDTDALAAFSNFGAISIDLAAPGLDIYTTAHSSDSAYASNQGTSFSAPMVSGALALLAALHPSDSYQLLAARLLQSVDPLPALAGKCRSGGRLNLGRALNPGSNLSPAPAYPVFFRPLTGGLKMRASLLLGIDPDGDPLSLSAVDPLSARGGIILSNADWLSYFPPAGLTNTDSFGYSVTDGTATSSGTVTIIPSVSLAPSLNLAVEPLPDGQVRVRGNGVPFRTYVLEFSDFSVIYRWQFLATVQADNSGSFEYVDQPRSASRSYRTVATQ